ncbi:MAG: hypothetical protein LBP92_00095 [Deltaproteobacteria bacterium]|jgi:hypothetical protein|nr:hypothetical protein [Deltaproteobacteria bacterium]
MRGHSGLCCLGRPGGWVAGAGASSSLLRPRRWLEGREWSPKGDTWAAAAQGRRWTATGQFPPGGPLVRSGHAGRAAGRPRASSGGMGDASQETGSRCRGRPSQTASASDHAQATPELPDIGGPVMDIGLHDRHPIGPWLKAYGLANQQAGMSGWPGHGLAVASAFLFCP